MERFFWAKTTINNLPGISVFQHMINVGCVAKCLAEATPELFVRFNVQVTMMGALAALHDLGKISPGFQHKCYAWLKENDLIDIAQNGCWDTGAESDHGKTSHAAIQDFLLETGCPRSTAKYIATVLAAHHGRIKYLPNGRGIRSPLIKAVSENNSGIDWDMERQKAAQSVWDFFGVSDCPNDSLTGDSSAIWWLAGLTSVADWIGSDERFFPVEVESKDANPSSRACHALDAIGFKRPVITESLSFEQIFGFPPNEMQSKTISTITAPGVYVIEAPMGLGKTEAALGAAYHLLVNGKANGIYFALPTQATSNRIHLRMNEYLQQITSSTSFSQLIHGTSWLLKDGLEYSPTTINRGDKQSADARDWFASAKRALLAPFGVGTVDQALLGVVAAKHFFVRHFALAGKVVILDEIHSYDLYTGTLLDKLITTLEGLGCTVIILSATLTGKRREQIVVAASGDCQELSYPLISGRSGCETFSPVAISPLGSREICIEFGAEDDFIKTAIELAQKGGAVLWICNTVNMAQRVFKRVDKLVNNDFPLGLLHSRFPHWRRDELEQLWMQRFGKSGDTRCGCILVSTQVVEQSVDLDADLLITELAPTDMLLQRLGRLWRHERANRPVTNPKVCILDEGESLAAFRKMEAKKIITTLGVKAKVYAPYVLLRSLEVWKQQSGSVSIPAQIRELIEMTYNEKEKEPPEWSKLFGEWYGTDSAKRMKAQMSSNIWQVALDDKEGVQTRLNELPTVTMVLCRNITGNDVQFIDGSKAKLPSDGFVFSTAKALHKNMVKIPEYCFEQLGTCSELNEYIYENCFLGIVEPGGQITVSGLKDKFLLHYTNELGLYIEKTARKEGL